MAIKFIQEKKKQVYLIVALVAVVLITIVILWQGDKIRNFSSIIPKSSIQDLNLPQYEEITINFDILKREDLKELVPFEEISPFDGEAGRENPFLRKKD